MEVLIIGAGVAGLAAAQTLGSAGVKTRIVEARDRIGGRILTARESRSGMPVELGAEFIHGKPPELLRAARTANLGILPMPPTHVYLRQGQPVDLGERSRKMDAVFARLSAVPDQAFSDFLSGLQTDAETRKLAINYVEGFNAARADRISTRSLAHESEAQGRIDGDEAFRFKDGYDHLPRWLWEHCGPNVTLSLTTVARRIEWRRGHVTVTVRDPEGRRSVVTANRVIVTLPLGVLKLRERESAAVRIQPQPANLDQALERLEMGHAVRVTLMLEDSFWQGRPTLGDAGFIHSDDPSFPTWWITLPGPLRGLTAWAGGPKAETLACLSDQRIVDQAIDALARILGAPREGVAAQVQCWYAHNWCNDPFARGAYSYALVGGLEAREELALPVEDTLYFAGEATDTEGHAATVHGAMASGRRSARQILAAS